MLDFIKVVAREAGRTAMQYFDGVRPNDVHAKASPKDMVSAALNKMADEGLYEGI